ncbi:MAG TPA: 5'/3'-nucleotidase SurE, partial [Acidimicrobiales bacterium]|nr:5'/3'-nucleotidase SurE [Acidimicrobiales bacterium]
MRTPVKIKARKLAIWATAVALVLGGTACSTSDSPEDSRAGVTTTAATTTAPGPAPITVVVTNDDGIGASGIDELARQLGELEAVTVKVVAPATNQSGTGDTTTDGEVAYESGETTSGIEGIAVAGTPADSVNVALDELGLQPDLIASGINKGQNVGPLAQISGTVGAALTGVRRGIPAVAGSAGLTDPDDALGARYVVEWVKANRTRIADGRLAAGRVVNINVPRCTAGSPHELVDVPTASEIPEGVNPFEADCATTPASFEPTDDVDALAHGFAARSNVP